MKSMIRHTNCASRHALSLIEVIVTISILSLLIGLLLPALSSVKTSARRTQCQANLRQMTIAATSYTALWDAYPPAIRYEQVDGVAHRVAWDWVTTFSGEVISPGALWQFTDHPDRVMQCPGYEGPANFSGDPYTGYNYNTDYIGGEAITPVFGWEVVRRSAAPHAVRVPSQTAIFGIGGFSGGATKFMRAPLSPNGLSPWITYSGGQALLYHGSTNVAYVDAHVESTKTVYDGQNANPQLLDQLGTPKNGFLSNDDSAYDPRQTTSGRFNQ